jgi:hypothetical protein
MSLLFFVAGRPALADTLQITATVPAPLPTQPAIITSHYDQQHITTANDIVFGTCSNDTAYVKLYRNEVFAGASLCDQGQFSVPLTFTAGSNNLQAKAMSSTDGEGPVGLPITVYYDVPQTPQAPVEQQVPKSHGETNPSTLFPSLQSSSVVPLPAFFFLSSEQTFLERKPNELVSWQLRVHGRGSPFLFTIDWGDGTIETEDFSEEDVTINHRYNKEGIYRVLVEAIDNAGNKAQLQFIVFIKGEPLISPTTPASNLEALTLLTILCTSAAAIALLSMLIAHRYIRKRKRSDMIQKDKNRT